MTDFSGWLERRYGTTAALSAAWHRPVASFADAARPAETPERKEDLPPQLDWLEFAEAAAPPDRQDGVLDYLPDAATASPGTSVLRLLYDRVRVAAREHRVSDTAPTVADVCGRAAPGASPQELDFAVRSALMHGATPNRLPEGCDASALGPLMETLGDRPWEADRKVLLLYPRIYARIKRLLIAAGPGGASASDRTFGFERPLQDEGPALLRKFIDLAVRAGLPPAISDTRLALEQLRRHALVVCPTLEVLEAEAMSRLQDYVADGGFLALGPRIPLLDETMRSNDTLARHFGEGLSDFSLELVRHGEGAFFTLPGYVSAATMELLAFESGLARGLAADAPGLDSAVQRSGNARLLCVANPNDYAMATTFSGETVRRVRNVETGETTPMGAEKKLTVHPATVSFWQVD